MARKKNGDADEPRSQPLPVPAGDDRLGLTFGSQRV